MTNRESRIREVRSRIDSILQLGKDKGILTYRDLATIKGDAGLQRPIMDLLVALGAFSKQRVDRRTIYSFKQGVAPSEQDIASIVDWRLKRISMSDTEPIELPLLNFEPEPMMTEQDAVKMLLAKGYMIYRPVTL